MRWLLGEHGAEEPGCVWSRHRQRHLHFFLEQCARRALLLCCLFIFDKLHFYVTFHEVKQGLTQLSSCQFAKVMGAECTCAEDQ